MANFGEIWDETGWLADIISLNQYSTYLTIREFEIIHGLVFELPSLEVHISWTHEVDGVEEGCFHLASLSCGLKVSTSRLYPGIVKRVWDYSFPTGLEFVADFGPFT